MEDRNEENHLQGVVIFGLLLITFFYVFSRTSEIFDENRAEKIATLI
ncbi:hypothetical protein ACEQPO_07730 [Bacillus sp. SL00103]